MINIDDQEIAGSDDVIQILLVDDDTGFLGLERTYLEREESRFRITTAGSVEEALDLIDEHDYDLIVSDYQMPEKDGLDFLRILREDRGDDIPFIMLTGKGREEVAMEALNLGADRYIQKGGEPRSLYGVLAQAIVQEVERSRASVKIEDLNSLLLSIRDVNQLIVGESDLSKVVAGSSRVLLETRGYLNVSIALLDDDKNKITPMGSAGAHGSRDWEYTFNGGGNAPKCVKDAIGSSKTTLIEEPSEYCEGCPHFEEHHAHKTILVPIIHRDTTVGFLTACYRPGRAISDAEIELLKEVAGDLGFAREKLKMERRIREKNRLLSALNRYSLKLASIPISDDIFSVAAYELKELTDAKIVSVSTYDKRTSDLVVQFTTLSEDKNKVIKRFLGRRMEGLRNKVTPEIYERITSQIVGDAGTLHETTFGAISKPVSAIIQKALGVEWFTGIALMHKGELMGTVVISGGTETKRPDNQELKAFAGVTANAVQRWRAERSLLESQGRWQFALEGGGDGIWDWNIENGEVSFSRRWKSMLGYEDSEIENILQEKEKRIHKEDRKYYRQELKKHLKGYSRYYDHEHRMRCKDGSYKWVLDRGKVIERAGDGKPLRMIGVQTDISRIKEAEKALREQKEFSENLLTSMQDGLSVLDENGVHVVVNPAFCEMTGFSENELIGIGTPHPYWPPEMHDEIDEIFKESLSKDSPELKMEFMRKDGERFPVLVTPSKIKDEDGRVLFYFATVKDISEMDQIQRELTGSEEKYRRLFETAQDGILILDAKSGEIIDANPYILDMLDTSLDEIKGKYIWDISPFGDIAENKERIKKLQKIGYGRYEDLPLKSEDGEERFVEFIINTYDTGGTEVIQCNIREITARKKAEKELRRREEHLSTILHSIGDAVLVTDSLGVVEFMNPVAEELTGWDTQDAEGADSSEVFNIVNSKTGEPVKDPVHKVLENGETKGLANHTMLISKDGEEYHIADSAAPIKDPQGEVRGVVLVFRDVMETYETQEEQKTYSEHLKERVKELGCLYRITKVLDEGMTVDETLASVVDAIPEGWRYPEITRAKIEYEDEEFVTDDFSETQCYMSHDIVIEDERVGKVEVHYTEDKDFGDEDPFLDEEREMLKTIAHHIAHFLDIHRKEEALRTKRDHYLSILDDFPALIWRSGTDGLCDYFNTTWLEFTGRSMDEEVGEGWAEGVHPDDLQRCLETYGSAFKDREPFDMEYRLMHHSGEYRWIIDFGRPFYDIDGEFAGYIGSCYDIHDRKRMEKKLRYRLDMESIISRASAELVHVSNEEIDDAIYRSLGSIGNFADVDRSYVFLFDDEVMNNTHEWCAEGIEPLIDNLQDISTSLYSWWMERLERFETIHVLRVEDLPPEASAEKGILESQNIKSVLMVPLVSKNTLKGFIGFDSVSEERSWSEEDIGLLETLSDIIVSALERKRTESALKENENKIKELYQASSTLASIDELKDLYDTAIEIASSILEFDVCTIAIEKNGRITVKASTDYDLIDNVSLKVGEGIAGRSYKDKRSFLIKDVREEHGAKPSDSRFRSGMTIPLGDIGVFQALSFEKAYYDESDLELGELFVSNIEASIERIKFHERQGILHSLLRHDVKNKAQVVQGYLQLLEELDITDEAVDFVTKSLEANKDSIELIRKIGLLIKANEETPGRVDIASEIHSAVDSLSKLAETNDINIEYDNPKDIGAVAAGSLLKEVFTNIIENSIYHSEASKIRISFTRTDGKVVCTIEDDGKGIPDDKKSSIFKKGFTVEKDRSTGLGLFLVKMLIEGYGGSIEVKDSELGGARFDIHLREL